MWWLLATALAAGRPASLTVGDGCDLYVGTASGNDPSVRVEVRVCPTSGSAVEGVTQWSSTTSGYSVREVKGHWSGETLLMADVRMIEDRPEPGWRFCTVDRYALERDGDTLGGVAVSAACDDHPVLSLVRVGEATASGGTTAGGDPPAPAPSPAPSPPAVVRGLCGGMGCASPGGAPSWAWLVLLVGLRRRS